MRRRPVSCRRHTDLAWIGLRKDDELGNGFGGHRRVHHHDEWHATDTCDRRDVADEIEVEFLIERRVDRVVGTDQEQRVAVCGRTNDHLRRDIGASTRPVFDDELLAEPLRQPLTHQARGDVIRTGWSKADHNAHRPRRVGLRSRHPRNGRQRGSARGQMEKISAGKFHDALLCSRPCEMHGLARGHLIASAPACAIWASSFASTPDTPMPPTILPSTTIGMPPSISIAPRTVRYFNPTPPPAIASSSALVARRNSTAVRALPSARPFAARCEPSRRCSITAWPPLSTIEMTTFQLFCLAFASAAAIAFLA